MVLLSKVDLPFFLGVAKIVISTEPTSGQEVGSAGVHLWWGVRKKTGFSENWLGGSGR